MKAAQVLSPPHLFDPLSRPLFRKILTGGGKDGLQHSCVLCSLVMGFSAGSQNLGQCLLPSYLNKVPMFGEGFLLQVLAYTRGNCSGHGYGYG